MKKILIALGVLVSLGVLAVWYTGKMLPQRLDAVLVQVNQQLKVALGHEGEGRIELLSLDTRMFSADARYRLTYESPWREPVQLEFVDSIEYGPLPWSRLKRLQLTPVMASSSYALEKTEDSAAWFVASENHVPVRGGISVSYGGAVSNQLEVAPFKISDIGFSASFTGMTVRMGSVGSDQPVIFSGELERLEFQVKGQAGLWVDLQSIEMNARLDMAAHGLRIGSLDIEVGDMSVGAAGMKVGFGKLEQRNVYQLADGGFSMRQSSRFSDISFASESLGSLGLIWRVEGLDPAALSELMRLDHSAASEAKALAAENPGGMLIDYEQWSSSLDRKHGALALRLLASKPRLILEELSLKTSSGESRADLTVGLHRRHTETNSLRVLLDDPVEHALETAQASVNVSRATVEDLARCLSRITPMPGNSWDVLSAYIVKKPFWVVTSNEIQMSLRVTPPEDAELNGRKLSLDELFRMLGRNSTH